MPLVLSVVTGLMVAWLLYCMWYKSLWFWRVDFANDLVSWQFSLSCLVLTPILLFASLACSRIRNKWLITFLCTLPAACFCWIVALIALIFAPCHSDNGEPHFAWQTRRVHQENSDIVAYMNCFDYRHPLYYGYILEEVPFAGILVLRRPIDSAEESLQLLSAVRVGDELRLHLTDGKTVGPNGQSLHWWKTYKEQFGMWRIQRKEQCAPGPTTI